MQYFESVFSKMFKFRLVNPVFDLLLLFKNGIDGFKKLSHEILLPCNVIQETKKCFGFLKKDLMCSFGDNSKEWNKTGFTPSDFVSINRCQQHYLWLHLGSDGFLTSEDCARGNDKREMTCPYYTVCELEKRKRQKYICFKRPWEIYNSNDGDSCWYGNAVASVLGKVNVTKKQK